MCVCVFVCVSPHLLRDDWTDLDQILYVTYVLLSHLKLEIFKRSDYFLQGYVIF